MIGQAEVGFAQSYFVGQSILSKSVGKTTSTPTGDASLVGPLYFPTIGQVRFQLNPFFSISPYMGFTVLGYWLLPRKAPDGGSKESVFLLGVPFSGPIGYSKTFEWNGGLGFEVYTIEGAGGTAVLNNGTNTNYTFGLPDASVSSKTFYWILGASALENDMRFGIDMHIHAPLSNTRRSFDFLFSFAYRVGGMK